MLKISFQVGSFDLIIDGGSRQVEKDHWLKEIVPRDLSNDERSWRYPHVKKRQSDHPWAEQLGNWDHSFLEGHVAEEKIW